MALSFVSVCFNLNSLVLIILVLVGRPANGCSYTTIFSFGDSLADTGNRLISTGMKVNTGRFPYGVTYFHRPTGRSSDGRIVLDFIAQGLGLPLLKPYLAGSGLGEGFRHGVNFAVAGATANENCFFEKLGLNVTWTEYNLGTQIEWFKTLLPSLRSSDQDSSNPLSTSLFLLGEIGGNDYNHALEEFVPVDKIRSYVPGVIKLISSAIHTFIELGAKTLVVPGITPLGCTPRNLAGYAKSRGSMINVEEELEDYYDPQTGCINWLNELSEHHNGLLQEELDRIRPHYPNATIIFADYFKLFMTIYHSPRQFGFGKALEACCGGVDPTNPRLLLKCGDKRGHLCDDPSSYVNWDGAHYTDATYRIIAQGLLEGPLKCPNSAEQISAY